MKTSYMRKKEIRSKLSGYTIIKTGKNYCAKTFKVLVLMRDHICFFQKTKVINESLMMTLF